MDYSFRIRVENKFGISDPSPYVTAFRSKLFEREPIEKYRPKDYELEHKPLELHCMYALIIWICVNESHISKQFISLIIYVFLCSAAPPKFLRQEEDVMYAIRGQPFTLEFWVYAHPDPNVVWSFEGQKV